MIRYIFLALLFLSSPLAVSAYTYTEVFDYSVTTSCQVTFTLPTDFDPEEDPANVPIGIFAAISATTTFPVQTTYRMGSVSTNNADAGSVEDYLGTFFSPITELYATTLKIDALALTQEPSIGWSEGTNVGTVMLQIDDFIYIVPYQFNVTSDTVTSCTPTETDATLAAKNTKFTSYGFTTSTSSGSVILTADVSWFLDTSEINEQIPAYNPQYVRFLRFIPDSTVYGLETDIEPITPFTSGNATSTGELTLIVPDNETHEYVIDFWNFDRTGSNRAMIWTYIIGTITIENGVITNTTFDPIYTGQQYDFSDQTGAFCQTLDKGLENGFQREMCQLIFFLFVPPNGIGDTLFTAFSIDKFPVIASAYQVFAYAETAVTTANVASTTAYKMELEIASSTGVNLPPLQVFALADVFGSIPSDTKSMVRGIILFGLILSFGMMIKNSIDNTITLNSTNKLR